MYVLYGIVPYENPNSETVVVFLCYIVYSRHQLKSLLFRSLIRIKYLFAKNGFLNRINKVGSLIDHVYFSFSLEGNLPSSYRRLKFEFTKFKIKITCLFLCHAIFMFLYVKTSIVLLLIFSPHMRLCPNEFNCINILFVPGSISNLQITLTKSRCVPVEIINIELNNQTICQKLILQESWRHAAIGNHGVIKKFSVLYDHPKFNCRLVKFLKSFDSKTPSDAQARRFKVYISLHLEQIALILHHQRFEEKIPASLL